MGNNVIDLISADSDGGGHKIRRMDCISSGHNDRDFEFKAESAFEANSYGTTTTGNAGEILDQGETGGCVGYAIAKAISLHKDLKKSHLDPYSIWMASKELDEFRSGPTTFVSLEGTSIRSGLDVVRKYGALPVGHMSNGMFNGSYADYIRRAAGGKIKLYERITVGSINMINIAIQKGPLVCRLKVDNRFMAGENKLDKPTGGNLGLHGLHAIVLAGAEKIAGKWWYTCINSWGTGWGNNGTCKMSEQYVMNRIDEVWKITA